MNLYEITKEMQTIVDELYNNGGELTPELEAALTINKENFIQKVEGYCKAKANIEGELVACQIEVDRLQQHILTAQKAIERIVETIKNAMCVYEIPKVSAGTFDLTLRKKKSVSIVDETAIPKEYIKIKEVVSISKSDIRKAFLAGEKVNGAELKETQSLNII